MIDDFDVRIASLPKVELHLHLEGAIRRQTLRELACQSDRKTKSSVNEVNRKPKASVSEANIPIVLGELPWERRGFQYNDLSHFLTIARGILNTCLRKVDDYERIAYELFADLAEQNVRYVEVSFSANRGLNLGIPFDEMLAAINTAKGRIVNERLMQVGLIVGFGRERGSDIATELAWKAAEFKKDGVVGIDLHGDEAAAPCEQFIEAFEIAKNAGLGLRAHAGEGAGAPSIWEAIRSLNVLRVAHGIRAIEDDNLIEYLRRHPITLDICPTSNFKLGLVESLSVHPIRYLFDIGIRVTVNSDDPLFFDTTITEEYQALRRHLGFTYNELKQITLYAVDGAFLPDEEKATLRREIERDFVTEELNERRISR